MPKPDANRTILEVDRHIKSRTSLNSRLTKVGLWEGVKRTSKTKDKYDLGSQSVQPTIPTLNPVLFNEFICVGVRLKLWYHNEAGEIRTS